MSVRTIDVRELPHIEREKLIFPGVEQLKDGETLRLILEFNPVPLVYMLKARGEFEVYFEKEGPDEWILNVKRILTDEKIKAHLKKLVQEARAGSVSDEAKEAAKGFFQSTDAKKLELIEHELMTEGVSADEIKKTFCDIHLEALKDSLDAQKTEVEPPHPVHTLMEEHKVILATLKKLRNLLSKLQTANSFDDLAEDMSDIRDVTSHLVEAENHHQREEEALFPKLEKHGITEPSHIMKLDHDEFRKRKRALYQLVSMYDEHEFGDFKKKFVDDGGYIAQEFENHIIKEDNILYQIALQVLTPQEWDEVKSKCDEIGYCCFTP